MRLAFPAAAVALALVAGGALSCAPRREPGATSTGAAASASAKLCKEHGVAEAACPFCHPELIEQLGMCAEHGLPEAICFACNPSLAPAFRAKKDWCEEHERPESQCWLCHPERDPMRDRPAAPAPPTAVTLEAAPASADGPRSRRAPSVHCTKQDLRVRFATAETAHLIGLEYATVEERRISKTIECPAAIGYDRGHYVRLSAGAPGVVDTVRKELGERVSAGEVLAVVSSAAIAEAKAAFLAARSERAMWERNQAREQDLLARGVSTERDAIEADARLAETRVAVARTTDELRRLGFSKEQIEEIARTEDATPRLALTAPFAGVLVERDAAPGETFEPARILLAVADVSRMCAELDVFEEDMRDVRVGQRVTVELDALRGEVFGGKIAWVSTAVDSATRTLAARAVLDNVGTLLKANLFGRATVLTHDGQLAATVPQDAVQWEGCCNVVFVRRDDTLFEPRKVTLGTSTGAVYEVLGGLEPGEVVVTTGSYLLKTELLKGSIGAGCCETGAGA